MREILSTGFSQAGFFWDSGGRGSGGDREEPRPLTSQANPLPSCPGPTLVLRETMGGPIYSAAWAVGLFSVLIAYHFADYVRTVVGAGLTVALAGALYPRALSWLVAMLLARLKPAWYIKVTVRGHDPHHTHHAMPRHTTPYHTTHQQSKWISIRFCWPETLEIEIENFQWDPPPPPRFTTTIPVSAQAPWGGGPRAGFMGVGTFRLSVDVLKTTAHNYNAIFVKHMCEYLNRCAMHHPPCSCPSHRV